jgi:hypothetical protein
MKDQTITNEWEDRKIVGAVYRSMSSCEKKRLNIKKPPIGSGDV